MLKIVNTQLNGKQLYVSAQREAFEEILNKEYLVSWPLVKYSNDVLKTRSSIVVADRENTMEHIAILYGYLQREGT